eukprot:TRINITY_DN56933_c0_g1_i1.p1 TRINITY_DN56933_c0_g1~~TRINITY_DN56933_c0_g1_i1.p1  ORF type:complete len:428 (-),score=75.45 TRINITY_DN56933_c0_g1_i1:48-1286(-)
MSEDSRSIDELVSTLQVYTRHARHRAQGGTAPQVPALLDEANETKPFRLNAADFPCDERIKSAWRKYHSIESTSDLTTLQGIRMEVAAKLGARCEWVASEKVHGCNFCLETDGMAVEYASRSNKLGDGAGFMNASVIMPKYHSYAQKAFQLAKEQHPGLGKLLIYGEYFGGYYPGHPAEKGSKTVQRGVAYSPANHFYAFDVSLDGNSYLDFDESRTLLLAAGFPLVAAPLARGPLDDLLSIDVECLKTALPGLLGHPPLERFQIAEGVVIRPAKEVQWGRNRCILKKKARAFWEATNQPGMALKVAREQLDQGLQNANGSPDSIALEAAKSYVNKNRLCSVISKDPGLLGESNLHKLAGLLTKDALEDFENEHADEEASLAKSMSSVRKALSRFCRFFTAEHIVDLRAELD